MKQATKTAMKHGMPTGNNPFEIAAAMKNRKLSSAVKEKKEKEDDDDDHDVAAVTMDEKTIIKLDKSENVKHKVNETSFDFGEPGWNNILQPETSKPYFCSLMNFLQAEGKGIKTIFPPREDWFHAFGSCPYEKTRVVIIGQDPYHQPGQAHGLCFSVRRGVQIPPSLRNIYQEAQTDVKIKKPSHGCLDSWSEQGVLLLNTVMTVRHNEPNSHQGKGWEKFTDVVIKSLSAEKKHLVFLLWGKPAQTKGEVIQQRGNHLIITSSHPSPLGATKTSQPFIGSKCFSRANEYLVKHNLEPIDWNVE